MTIKSALCSIVRFFSSTGSDLKSEPIKIRKGILLEVRKMEYPQFRSSVLHNIRFPSTPLHLFKIENTNSLARETFMVFADLTSENEGAIAGMPVTVRSRRDLNSFESVQHTVVLD